MSRQTRNWLVGLLTTYGIACALPALGRNWREAMPGIYCLAPFFLLHPAWWANPLFFAGCVALARGKDRVATTLGLVASVLAVGFVVLCRFEGFMIGSYFWMASMIGLVMAGIDPQKRPGKSTRSIEEEF